MNKWLKRACNLHSKVQFPSMELGKAVTNILLQITEHQKPDFFHVWLFFFFFCIAFYLSTFQDIALFSCFFLCFCNVWGVKYRKKYREKKNARRSISNVWRRKATKNMALSYIFVASSLEKQWGGGYFLLYGSCISGIKEKPALKIKRSAEVGCAEVKAVTSRGSQHFSPLVLFFVFFSHVGNRSPFNSWDVDCLMAECRRKNQVLE